MVVEMLLNNDIQIFFVQMILIYQKEINVHIVHYWNFLKKISNHFI